MIEELSAKTLIKEDESDPSNDEKLGSSHDKADTISDSVFLSDDSCPIYPNLSESIRETLKDAKQIEKEAIKMIKQMEYGEHGEGKTS